MFQLIKRLFTTKPKIKYIPDNIKQVWIDALRSGKYRQGNSQLRDKFNCYCPLGVLADIIAPDEWTLDKGEWRHLGELYFPSLKLAKWLTFTYDDLAETERGFIRFTFPIVYYGQNVTIDHLNDIGISFPELADLIEEQVDDFYLVSDLDNDN